MTDGMRQAGKLGLWSGVGLVVADMVGTGVLTTAGFMAPNLAPTEILLAWLVGALAALAGARAYAALARAVPRSGGEYRYLSTLLHPAAGTLAGWTSLLVGFSMPVALAALAAGAFVETLWPQLSSAHAAYALVIGITAMHVVGLRFSRRAQDVLVLVKGALLLAFVIIGLALGAPALPAPSPALAGRSLPLEPFFVSLVFISFCFSGWNAAIYAAEEFAAPARDVPRAMLIGCALVAGLYLLVNFVFVANLGPSELGGWLKGDTRRITLAHLVMTKLVGDTGARVMSVAVIVALASAVSAMTVIGPRVYAAMARDGSLPRVLAGAQGRPPVGAILLQAVLALVLVQSYRFRELLEHVGAILALVTALTALSLFRVRFGRTSVPPEDRPGVLPLACATVYAALSGWMIVFAVRNDPDVLRWIAGLIVIAGVAHLASVVTRSKRAAQ